MIPAPLVTVQNVGSDNMSIVVSVTSPSMVHVIRYRMIYKLMGEYIKSGTEIIKNGSTFEYTLPKVGSYALTVSIILMKLFVQYRNEYLHPSQFYLLDIYI